MSQLLPISTLVERSAILEHALARYTARGFDVLDRTETTAILYRPKIFRLWLALLGLLFFGVGLIMYIAFFVFLTRDQRLRLEVDRDGKVHAIVPSAPLSFGLPALLGIIILAACLVLPGIFVGKEAFRLVHQLQESSGIHVCSAAHFDQTTATCSNDDPTLHTQEYFSAKMTVDAAGFTPRSGTIALDVTVDEQDNSGAFNPIGHARLVAQPVKLEAQLNIAGIFSLAHLQPNAGVTYQLTVEQVQGNQREGLGRAVFTLAP